MNDNPAITSCKSYLEFISQGLLEQAYSIAEIENTQARFEFDLPKKSAQVRWIIETDFELAVDNVICTHNGHTVRIERNSNQINAGKCVYDLFLPPEAGKVEIDCHVYKIPIEQAFEDIRQLYQNELAHVEQLIESERTLQSQVQQAAKEKAETESNLQAQIQQLKTSEQELQVQIKKVAKEKEEVERDLQSQVQQLKTNEEDLQTRIRQLRVRQSNYDALKLKADELDDIKGSRSWKYMCKIWDVRDIVLPKGSKRRLHVKKALKLIRHPIKTIGNLSNYNSLESTSTDQIGETSFYKEPKQSYDRFDLTTPSVPLISIVIPVYNQFVYTYDCIKSIKETCGGIPYEIIVADDCSTDQTRNIEKVIHGLRIIHNKQNLRFLLNCNNAAQEARGKYLLFLNNDTEVKENWLQSLLDLIESDPTIGMVGSKLVYPNGKLQEAGGIVFADASGWNYGRLDDPDRPEYNYVKDVDYISGASIMIRADLWRQLGGFDASFAPAYYEDTDLAFSVRKAGLRVVYQPESVVVHFEGISNGKDVAQGQKAYQEVNRKKFYEKWKDILQNEQCKDSRDLFLARDRSQAKKRLLMVDHYVPTFDKDAGSRAVYSYLQLFVRKGYQVTFMGDNYAHSQPYTQVLQRMGVEVLYGDWYYLNWQDWLKEHAHYFDYAFLNRPHITVKYIDIVRENSQAKIIYFGHDLIFLREHREYEVTKDSKFLTSSENWKKQELALMRKADISYYPSCVEEEIVHKIDPNIHVRAVPLYQYENVPDREYNFTERQDLMFIGGYNHRPNVDAAKWFAKEIVPELVKKLPDIRIHLMGSNAPQEVIDLADDHILFEGAVSDEELEAFYTHCRVSVVPLRYGAGIKGKVLEAMSLGMPVMTTSIGAEGIAGAESILCIEDDAKLFAERLAKLYDDAEDLKRRSRESIAYIRDNFSSKKVEQVIGQDFEMDN